MNGVTLSEWRTVALAAADGTRLKAVSRSSADDPGHQDLVSGQRTALTLPTVHVYANVRLSAIKPTRRKIIPDNVRANKLLYMPGL
jgi:hypothetical protein